MKKLDIQIGDRVKLSNDKFGTITKIKNCGKFTQICIDYETEHIEIIENLSLIEREKKYSPFEDLIEYHESIGG